MGIHLRLGWVFLWSCPAPSSPCPALWSQVFFNSFLSHHSFLYLYIIAFVFVFVFDQVSPMVLVLAPFPLSPCQLFSPRWILLQSPGYSFTEQKQIENWSAQFIFWSKRTLQISHSHTSQKYKTYGMSAGQITRAMVMNQTFFNRNDNQLVLIL